MRGAVEILMSGTEQRRFPGVIFSKPVVISVSNIDDFSQSAALRVPTDRSMRVLAVSPAARKFQSQLWTSGQRAH
jgi:hypothetical protein